MVGILEESLGGLECRASSGNDSDALCLYDGISYSVRIASLLSGLNTDLCLFCMGPWSGHQGTLLRGLAEEFGEQDLVSPCLTSQVRFDGFCMFLPFSFLSCFLRSFFALSKLLLPVQALATQNSALP